MHVKNEANVPGAYFIFPTLNKVSKITLNFSNHDLKQKL